MVAVRSQYHVDDTLRARLDGKEQVYRIVSISRDDSHDLRRYDLITLQKIQKVGGSRGTR